MLLNFRFKNYKVFKEEQLFSLIAHKPFKEHQDTHLVSNDSTDILYSAVLYGANASGKSIFIEAMDFARRFILQSSKESRAEDPIETEPFLLHTSTEQMPSEFEFTFLHEGKRFRYGFSVTNKAVEEEWLYVKNKKEVEYFYRSGSEYDYNKSQLPVIKLLLDRNMVRDNALILSVMAQFNEAIALSVTQWIDSIGIISGLDSDTFRYYTVNRIKEDHSFERRILNLLKAADLGIVELEVPAVDLPAEYKDTLLGVLAANHVVKTFRYKYDTYNRPILNDLVSFDMEDSESKGTQKYFALLGPILETLDKGHILIIDELDARLHPNLVREIVNLFHQPETNPNHAQLIVATHNTNMMNRKTYRRDQIWYINKDTYGASRMYSLMNIKSQKGGAPELGDNYELKYLRGSYKAVPSLWQFDVNKEDFSTLSHQTSSNS